MNTSFKLIKTTKVKEINSEVFQYEHIKTGARVLYIKNEDKNKVFAIGFKTPPEDNTGCPHILEHSVLNGSKNFPAKNTFTELMKGSMKTFLNAFTGSDKTMYPIASTNDQDYFNLMHVYLDAVFYPKIYEDDKVLKQEGWHHELFRPEDPVVYRGVVYNEMKGAFSTPESVLFRTIEKTQFPDTPYGFESGGDPDFIPDLSWEKFKAFHARYYHPSNSWTYLYGELDIDKALSLMDENYLGNLEQIDPQSDIPFQKTFEKPLTVTENYSIGEDENPDGKDFLSLNFTCANVLEVNTTTSLYALKQILMDSPASPLKLAIQNSNLCEDNYASFDDNCLQPTFSIICKNVKSENVEPLSKLIFSELNRIAEEGIDKKLIEATVNRMEFMLREAETGRLFKGLYYGFIILKSWIHNGDPLAYIEYEPILAELRKGLKERYFELLIEEHLLSNPHASRVILKPVKGLVKQKDEKTGKILADYKTGLSVEEIRQLIDDNLKLQEWQSTPDAPEDIAKIPFISIQDIRKEAEKLPFNKEQHQEIILLKHPVFTNGIVYTGSYFDINHLQEEELPWASLLTGLFGNLDTENYSFADLANEIDINTGGITTDVGLYLNTEAPEAVALKLVIRSKSVVAKTEKMLELVAETVFRTRFTNAVRIKQLIREYKSRTQMMLISYGHMVAIRRMLSQHSRMHLWQDQMEGMEFYSFLTKLDKQMETNPSEVLNKLKTVAGRLFTKQNLILSITAPEEDINSVWKKTNLFTEGIAKNEYQFDESIFNPDKKNEGLIAPVNVQYCAQGGSFAKTGYKYSGQMMVLSNILKNDFLMQELRVKGGAYGIMVLFSLYGNVYFCSYRDPNLKETLDTYKNIPAYLKNFKCSPRDFEKYIIGTMAELDIPYSPYQKGINSDLNYISGISEELRQQTRNEILSTTIEDIRNFAGLVEAVLKQNQIAVFGVESKLKENKQLFDRLVPVIAN